MANWSNLEEEISNWLSKLNFSDDVTFRKVNEQIIEHPSYNFKSDGAFFNDSVLISVEVEVGKKHPEANVVKYWPLSDKYKKNLKKIILFHIYTPDCKRPGFIDLAQFCANKMDIEYKTRNKQFVYKPFDYRMESGGDSYITLMKNLQSEIINEANHANMLK